MSRPDGPAATERALIAVIRDACGVEIAPDRGFFEAGLDSATLVAAHDRIQQALAVEFPVVEMFRYVTPRALAGHLSGARDAVRPIRAQGASVDSSVRADAPIAIVGMACRLPGAPNLDTFWRNLVDGVESITRMTDDELLAAGVAESELEPGIVAAGGMLAGYDQFDAELFGMTSAEAELCDPQIRVFLEICHSALEHAGYDPFAVPGTVGVFGAASQNRYLRHSLARRPDLRIGSAANRLITLNDTDFVAPQVSYRLDLRGPSISARTACASSLVTVHLAVQALRAGECDMALAGGASVDVYNTSYEHLPLPDDGQSHLGYCRPFDAAADGTVHGSGCGAVVLKRLDEALAQGDQVLAVIRGTAVSNDGADRASFNAPGVAGQAAAITAAMTQAGIRSDEIDYVEANAVGSLLGDAVELSALGEAYRALSDTTLPAASVTVGSVKSNIGHLNAASGIAGLVKTVLMLTRQTIVPTINFTSPIAAIQDPDTPFTVATATRPWPRNAERPRGAAVSNAGIGGGNAHVVLAEAPAPEQRQAPDDQPRVLLLSARSEPALAQAREGLVSWLAGRDDQDFADAVATLQHGRTPHPVRWAAVCDSVDDAVAALADPDRAHQGATTPYSRTVFLFPGTPVDEAHSCRALYGSVREFTIAMDECLDLFDTSGLPLDAIWAGADTDPAAGRGLVFALEYSLATTLMAWTGSPELFVGHGVGELAAAVVAGAVDLPEAVDLLATGKPVGDVREPAVPIVSARTGRASALNRLTDPGYSTDWPGADENEQVSADAVPVGGARLVQVGPGRAFLDLVLAHAGADADQALAVPTVLPNDGADSSALLTAATRLWVGGAPVDWLAVGQPPLERRIALPGYPYERRRYWSGQLESTPEGPDWRSVEWVRRPRTAAAPPPAPGASVLVLAPDSDSADSLTSVLAAAGYRVRCHTSDEPERLLAEFATEPAELLVHATGLAAEPAAAPERYLAGVATLAERLAPESRLIVLTRHAVDVSGDEPVWPCRAAAQAAVRAARAAGSVVGLVDVSERTPLADLAAELSVASPEAVIAVRGKQRWRPREDKCPPVADARPPLTDDGVYLVTGAFGEVGSAVAEELAAAGTRPRLILLDEPAAADRPGSEDLLARLRALGAQPHVAAATATDPVELRSVLAAATARLGPIQGVVRADTTGSLDEVAAMSARLAEVLDPRPDFVLLVTDGSPVGDYVEAATDVDAAVGGRVLALRLPAVARPATDAPGSSVPVLELDEDIDLAREWALDEHRLGTTPALPAAWYLDRVVTRFTEHLSGGAPVVELTDVWFGAPLTGAQPRTVRVSWHAVDGPPDRPRFTFAVRSGHAGGTHTHVTGTVAALPDSTVPALDLSGLRAGLSAEPPDASRTADPRRLGPRWQNLTESRLLGEERLVRLELMAAFGGDLHTSRLHPALLDTALTATGNAGAHAVSCRRMTVRADLPAALYGHVRWRREAGATSADLVLADENGAVLADVDAFTWAGAEFDGDRPPATTEQPRRTVDVARALCLLAAGVRGTILAGRPVAATAPTRPASAAAATPAAARQAVDLTARLRELWWQTLGDPPENSEEDFFEAGGDSLAAMELMAKIRSIFAVKLSIAVMLDEPTFGGMCDALEKSLAAAG